MHCMVSFPKLTAYKFFEVLLHCLTVLLENLIILTEQFDYCYTSLTQALFIARLKMYTPLAAAPPAHINLLNMPYSSKVLKMDL